MGNLYLRMKKVIAQGVRDLFPGYFALVMATGIISIDAFLSGWDRVARLFFPQPGALRNFMGSAPFSPVPVRWEGSHLPEEKRG